MTELIFSVLCAVTPKYPPLAYLLATEAIGVLHLGGGLRH